MKNKDMVQRLTQRYASEQVENRDLYVETLFENEWVSMKKMVYLEAGIKGYTYSHETRCKGHIVSVLPFRLDPLRPGQIEVLLREEVTPCWHPTKAVTSSITGGCEDNSTPEEDVCRELEEEAGYKVTPDKLISLGSMFGTKSSDTVYHLFTVDLTGMEKDGDGSGDGTELEALAKCVWKNSPMGAQDPFVFASWVKLQYNDAVKDVLGFI